MTRLLSVVYFVALVGGALYTRDILDGGVVIVVGAIVYGMCYYAIDNQKMK